MSNRAEPPLRTLTNEDVPGALELSTEAGWNQTEHDWNLLIELAPRSCFGVDVDGELASTATLVCYGHRLAWIGMVLTRAKYRGRGFAKRLLIEALRLADAWNIETVKLDATDQGQPLYEKLGFRSEQVTERWIRETRADTSSGEGHRTTKLGRDVLRADLNAFGADRSELLLNLTRRNVPVSQENSYVLTRSGRLNSYIGPCVAETPKAARGLIEVALRESPEASWYWDLLAENNEAARMARDLGFARSRRLLRMVRGKDLRGEESRIFALAGFELG